MRPRGWVTLSIRLVGLASALFGVYQVISIIQAAESFKALASFGEFARDTPVAGMFNAEVFRPSYLGPVLWTGVGLLLMLISGPLTRLLFSGLEAPLKAAEAPEAAPATRSAGR
jgi:hypothetical protein